MSDHNLQGDHNKNHLAQKRPRHSVWMFNGTQTSWDSASVIYRSFSIRDHKEENQASAQGLMLVPKVESKRSTLLDADLCAGNSSDLKRSQQGEFHAKSDVANLVKTNCIDATKFGAEISKEALRNLRNISSNLPDQHSLSISVNQRMGNILAPRKHLAVCNEHISSSQIDDGATAGTSNPDFSSRLLRLGLSDPIFPSKDTSNQTESLSHKWPSNFVVALSEENNLRSARVASKENIDTNFTYLEHDHRNQESSFTYLLVDKKKDEQLFARSPEEIYRNPNSRLKTDTLWLNGPSANKLCFPDGDIAHEYSCTPLSPCHCSPVGSTDSEVLNRRDCHLLHRMPMCPVHDVDTSTTCYTVDSMKGIHRDPQLLSQTSKYFSDTKKTEANSVKETHVIKEPIRFTNSKSSPVHDLLTIPSTSDLRDSLVPQLQNSRISTRRKRKVDITNAVRDESPAETDTINITNFPVRKPFTGAASFPLIKDLLLGQSPVKSQSIVGEIGEIRSRKTDRNISDRKQQTLRLLAAEDSIQNRALSTSVTESLDVENIYSYVEQPEKHNFNFPHNYPFVQQNMRWVKRLKLGEPCTSSLGSKRSEMGDFSSGDRENELHCKIIENSDSSSSHLILNRFPDEGQMEMGRGTALLNKWDSISLELAEKCQYLFLSHPWIQRWCHKSQQMKPTKPVTHEPENSKATMDEFRPKKLPSIAAMALVGKVTRSFQPCRTRKRGSVMIWNIEGIR